MQKRESTQHMTLLGWVVLLPHCRDEDREWGAPVRCSLEYSCSRTLPLVPRNHTGGVVGLTGSPKAVLLAQGDIGVQELKRGY